MAANSRLRMRLQEEAAARDVRLHIAPLRLCTDNAVMGAIAIERYKAGLFEDLSLEIYPGLVRPDTHRSTRPTAEPLCTWCCAVSASYRRTNSL